MFADEDIEPQNFWASSKSHVATTFLCMHFCSNYIGWSNQGKYYEIETHYAKQDVATWLLDEANIFQFNIFKKTQANWLSRLATRVTIFGTLCRSQQTNVKMMLTKKVFKSWNFRELNKMKPVLNIFSLENSQLLLLKWKWQRNNSTLQLRYMTGISKIALSFPDMTKLSIFTA